MCSDQGDRKQKTASPLHQQRQPACVEAVVQFGFPKDLVKAIYRRLLHEEPSRHAVNQSGSDVAESQNGRVTAAMLLMSVEAATNSEFPERASCHENSHSHSLPISEGQCLEDQQVDGAQRHVTTGDEGESSFNPSRNPHQDNPKIISTNASESAAVLASIEQATVPSDTTVESANAETPVHNSGSSSQIQNITLPGTSVTSFNTVSTSIMTEELVPSLDGSAKNHSPDHEQTEPTSQPMTAAYQHASRQSEATCVTDVRTVTKKRQLENLLALRAENKRLKARMACRQCRQRPVNLTFLPCGHFCFCQECGSAFQTCPVCGKTILADVRTFVS